MATLFENGIVVTLGAQSQVIWSGAVAVDGEQIVGVGAAADLRGRFPRSESVDCSGKLILPGFICAHHHFYSTMARGMSIPGAPASNFVEILERLWWKLDRALLDEDVTLSAQIPLIECIRNGTTTVIDHHASPGSREGSLDLIESRRASGRHQGLTVLRGLGPERARRRHPGKSTLHPEGGQG